MREGNLEAPTRHPLDWKNPEFYDQGSLMKEMERVFDICHGCRRCVSLCQSFPNLFDLVDATDDGEVHGVAKGDYWKVVDQCYLCDLCYMTKCPYTPPHAWNLDFPHLMLRAKAVKFRQGKVGASEQLLASTDRHGQFAGIPRRRRRQQGQRDEDDAQADGLAAGRAPRRLDAGDERAALPLGPRDERHHAPRRAR